MQRHAPRLGRGLSSLISMPPDFPAHSESDPHSGLPAPVPTHLKLDHVTPNPFQPRKDIAADDLEGLADSIRKAGVIQPIVVRPRSDGGYEIVAGERRWRACRIAGLQEIPVSVRDASDEEMLELALVENIFREDLNPIERASAYRRYCDEFGLSADEVANRLGEDRTTVTNYLRLLELPEAVRQWVVAGELAMGHARCLLGLKSPDELVKAARLAIDRHLSVRAVERLVREWTNGAKPPQQQGDEVAPAKRPQIRTLEQSFIRALNTKVEIEESRRKGSGRIVIHYFSLDDFDRIAERLGVPAE